MSQINFEDETLDASDGVTKLLLAAEYWKAKASALRAKVEQMERQEPVGTAMLCVRCRAPFDGGYYCPACDHHTATEETVYALPGAQPAPSVLDEEAAYSEWFRGEQGVAYDGMWAFAKAAWMARAALAAAAIGENMEEEK